MTRYLCSTHQFFSSSQLFVAVESLTHRKKMYAKILRSVELEATMMSDAEAIAFNVYDVMP